MKPGWEWSERSETPDTLSQVQGACPSAETG
jgi:hypothetical protein